MARTFTLKIIYKTVDLFNDVIAAKPLSYFALIGGTAARVRNT